MFSSRIGRTRLRRSASPRPAAPGPCEATTRHPSSVSSTTDTVVLRRTHPRARNDQIRLASGVPVPIKLRSETHRSQMRPHSTRRAAHETARGGGVTQGLARDTRAPHPAWPSPPSARKLSMPLPLLLASLLPAPLLHGPHAPASAPSDHQAELALEVADMLGGCVVADVDPGRSGNEIVLASGSGAVILAFRSGEGWKTEIVFPAATAWRSRPRDTRAAWSCCARLLAPSLQACSSPIMRAFTTPQPGSWTAAPARSSWSVAWAGACSCSASARVERRFPGAPPGRAFDPRRA